MATQQVKVGSFQASLWSWLASAISVITLVIHVICLGLPEWTWFPNSYKRRWGIWLDCAGDSCTSWDMSERKGADALRSVQAFACIALILLLGAVVVSVLRIMKSGGQTNKLFAIILIGIHGAACFCLMITFALWSSKFMEEGKLGASFGLEVVCFILELAAAAFMVLDLLSQRK